MFIVHVKNIKNVTRLDLLNKSLMIESCTECCWLAVGGKLVKHKTTQMGNCNIPLTLNTYL